MPENPSLVTPKIADLGEARKHSGLTYRALAAKIAAQGMPSTFGGVAKIFRGQPTSIQRAQAISQALGRPIQDLFTHGNGDPIGRHHV